MRGKWAATLTALLIVLFVIFFPQILSTTVGKYLIEKKIEAKTGTDAKIGYLHLTWFGPQKISNLSMKRPDFEGLVANLQADLPLWKLDDLLKPEKLVLLKGDLSLQGGSFHFKSQYAPDAALENLGASFRLHEGTADFTISGYSLQDNQKGTISIQGQITNFFAATPSFSIRGELSNFPTLALARYLAFREAFSEKDLLEIVGSSFSLRGSLSIQQDETGSCDLSLHTQNGNAEIHGILNRGIFTLAQPLQATIRLTEALSRQILSGLNPMFLTGIEAKNPIRLRIEPMNSRLFLKLPFKWSSLQIGRGMLDPGKIRCKNGSALGTMISLLKNDFFSRTKEMEVWFTPLFFSLDNGLVQTGRMDALAAGKIRFCTWGNIDLNRDKVDMILGLTAETLRFSFGLKRVPSDYVLKIPITGTIRHPKVAAAAAAAKIAALIAAQHAPGGGLKGGLLNIFMQPESDVPQPNRPFPWEH